MHRVAHKPITKPVDSWRTLGALHIAICHGIVPKEILRKITAALPCYQSPPSKITNAYEVSFGRIS